MQYKMPVEFYARSEAADRRVDDHGDASRLTVVDIVCVFLPCG
jgi:hypothetical protein